jgi:hypothetical protein
MMKRFCCVLFSFIVIFLLITTASNAQNFKPETLNLKALSAYEDSLKTLGDSVLHGSSDDVRKSSNEIFKDLLEKALNEKGSFAYRFDSVKTLGIQTAPDNSFRIYNWLLPSRDGSSYSYYGFVQTYDKSKDQSRLWALIDSSKTLVNPQSLKLRSDNWYGALYYKILLNKKSGKNYYTLLGWHGKDRNRTQKIIDVIYFTSGKPMFGHPLFKTDKVYSNRIIFEYISQAMMSLKYEEKEKMIVFDHLASPSASDGSFMAGPDGTYDAFRFKSGHWLYIKDIDMRTQWEPKKQPKHPAEHEMPIEQGK